MLIAVEAFLEGAGCLGEIDWEVCVSFSAVLMCWQITSTILRGC